MSEAPTPPAAEPAPPGEFVPTIVTPQLSLPPELLAWLAANLERSAPSDRDTKSAAKPALPVPSPGQGAAGLAALAYLVEIANGFGVGLDVAPNTISGVGGLLLAIALVFVLRALERPS